MRTSVLIGVALLVFVLGIGTGWALRGTPQIDCDEKAVESLNAALTQTTERLEYLDEHFTTEEGRNYYYTPRPVGDAQKQVRHIVDLLGQCR